MTFTTAKALSAEDRDVLVEAGLSFTEKRLLERVQYSLTWGPAPQRGGNICLVHHNSIPNNIWNALLEMEQWGAARQCSGKDGDFLLVDNGLFEMVMKVIRLLLDSLLNPQTTIELKPRESHPRAVQGRRIFLEHDNEGPGLG